MGQQIVVYSLTIAEYHSAIETAGIQVFPGGSAGYGSDFSLLWLWLHLQHRFDPWPGKFHMLQAQPEKTNKQKTKNQKKP